MAITLPRLTTHPQTQALPVPSRPLTYREREVLRLVKFARLRAAYIARHGRVDLDIFDEWHAANPDGVLYDEWARAID